MAYNMSHVYITCGNDLKNYSTGKNLTGEQNECFKGIK